MSVRSTTITKMSAQSPPKALFFDVFGTLVDWRTSVHRAVTTLVQTVLHDSNRQIDPELRARASALTDKDWHDFTQAWRNEYYKFTRTHYLGQNRRTFVTVDEHHLQSLQQLLQKKKLEGLLTETELQNLSLAWHDLEPWSDTVEGLNRLNSRFVTSTLSNGNTSLLKDLSANASLKFAHFICAEDFRVYKPAPEVYHGAARKLGLETSDCALVATHMTDLAAAKACGFHTIYVERVNEETMGSQEIAQVRRDRWVDLWVELGRHDGICEVAAHFGV